VRTRRVRFQGRYAFTLIEIIAVVAVVGILVAILLPALNSARRASRSAACLVNLRSIGQAVQMYRGDNDDLLPFAAAPIDVPLDYRDPLPALEQYLDAPIPRLDDKLEIVSGPPFVCPDDHEDWPRLGASYYYIPIYDMNFWFNESGFEKSVATEPARRLDAQRRVTENRGRDPTVVLWSENQAFHVPMSGAESEFPLAGRNVLLLDGSARRAQLGDQVVTRR